MAIERTTINGDATALKNALDTLVPTYFASVTLENIIITCKDADDNIVFKIDFSSATWRYTIYRNGNGQTDSILQTQTYDPLYFYKVGVNGAFLRLNGYGGVIAIAKAANGKTAIVIPGTNFDSYTQMYSVLAGCWGDDNFYIRPLVVANYQNPMQGNNCQFVPVPLYGNYQLANNIPKVFYMPMSQSNMRGIVQEVTSESGTYITDGYIAMIDDGNEE